MRARNQRKSGNFDPYKKNMHLDVQLKPDLDLEELSSIALAINFWEKPETTGLIHDFFSKRYEGFLEMTMQEWQNIIKKFVVANNSKHNAPEKLAKIIEDRIIILGYKIFYYVKRMIEVHDYIGLHVIDHIQWKFDGTVDELKTFQSTLTSYYYLKDQKSDLSSEIMFLYAPTKNNFTERTRFVLITLYLCRYYKRDTAGAVDLYNDIMKLKSTNSQLFRICLEFYFVKSAKYYYSSIKNEKERREILITGAERCIELCQNTSPDGYEREKILEIFIFLLNNMEYSEKLAFITKNVTKKDMLSLFAYVWPYQKLIWPIIHFIWSELTTADHQSIRTQILLYLNRNFWMMQKERYVHKNINEKILKKYLKKSQKNFIFKKLSSSQVKRYFEMFYYSTICILFNHTSHDRKALFDMGMPDLESNITWSQFSIVEKYENKICSTDDEKKLFRYHLDRYYFPEVIKKLVTKNSCFLRGFLNWRFKTEDEKNKFKKEVIYPMLSQTTELRSGFHINNYFDFTDQKNHVLDALYKSLSNEIFFIWGTTSICGSKFAEQECLRFVKSFINNDREMTLFKQKAFEKNENFVKNFCDGLQSAEAFETITDFFKFCLIDFEDVKNIKKIILGNFDWWIWTYGVKSDKFLILNKIMIWAVQTEIQKRDILGIHVNSLIGAVLSITLLKKCEYKKEDCILKFFNSWVKPFGNVKKIKIKLEELKQTKKCKFTQKDVIGVIKLLDKLEGKVRLTSEDIECVAYRHADSYHEKEYFL